MTIPELQAKEFAEDFFNAGIPNTFENLKDRLDNKLFLFRKDKDQLDFLKVLVSEISIDIQSHEEKCTTIGCHYRKEREPGIFLIQQEVDEINSRFEFEPDLEDRFSTEDEISLHNKLNNIIENLKSQELGQEVLYEEIESMKNHFNLGKKTWFQLLKGKLVDVAIEKGVEIFIVQQIYDALADGFTNGVKLLIS
jgi:hypothetical protein